MRRIAGRLLTVLLWACLAAAASLIGLRWVDSSVGIVVVLQALVPVVGLGVAGLLVVAALARRWRVAIAAGALFTVCATLALPSVLSRTVPPGPNDLVVMSANLEFGRADAQDVVVAVRDHRVDVLVLVEITPAAVERLRLAGLDSILPESVGLSRKDAGGTIIRSRIALTLLDPGLGDDSHNALNEPNSAFNAPVVSIHRPGGDVVIRAVHPQPPNPSDAAAWRSDLTALETWREGLPAGRPVVIAGDFNSSQSHPGFRRVAETLTDAHRVAGLGWVRTWPMGSRVPPFIQLDHVLVRGLGVADAGVVTLPDTDHRAVWARLSPPRP